MIDTLAAAFAALDVEADTYRMEPLTVTAELRSVIAVTQPQDLALDGILAAELLQAATDGDLMALPDVSKSPLFCRLPLAMQGAPEWLARLAQWLWGRALCPETDMHDQPWWYACSTPRLLDSVAQDTHHWNKRFDSQYQEHLDPAVQKVVIEKGRYKAYHQMLPTVTCRAVQWSVMGDAVALERILTQVDYLSKKRAYGYGAVLRWRVEGAPADESLWGSDGTLARPVPLGAIDVLGITDMGRAAWYEMPGRAYIAYRAPQWLPCNQSLCLIGGQRRQTAAA